MKNYIILFFLFGCSSFQERGKIQSGACQSYYDKKLKIKIFHNVDERAEFPEGFGKEYLFFAKRMKYPDQDNFQGSIKGSFIVDKDGAIISPRIEGKKEEDYTPLDLEFIRVSLLMPKWRPAKCNGKNVATRVIAPIRF
ncbi:hypothetical protein SRABI27_01297 [Pedobacter sp. Bi27]|uniref:energy transducer TonB n=1 Tax=unclassified Pedobacter TaxID=2628915 RepID=UPI001DE24FA8|nr:MULTISPECIES: energy transducer TonB [unclassified Pedobacter]CAH0182704.1 hypothetical protein SRABI27_01297 [Pedobacter sp. Bi27]CAH0291841.1 hypothetical protein SRABI36_04333 [Pedobacter sp. Bi36]CAH0303248.1 hypothetical protein SRABI126_04454 [Pedobacter sp. Bi126]